MKRRMKFKQIEVVCVETRERGKERNYFVLPFSFAFVSFVVSRYSSFLFLVFRFCQSRWLHSRSNETKELSPIRQFNWKWSELESTAEHFSAKTKWQQWTTINSHFMLFSVKSAKWEFKWNHSMRNKRKFIFASTENRWFYNHANMLIAAIITQSKLRDMKNIVNATKNEQEKLATIIIRNVWNVDIAAFRTSDACGRQQRHHIIRSWTVQW